jgi:nucleotide-binding universal stress UspA family protein
MYSRIVVPLDGSDIAASALEPAKELARLYDAPIFLVRAVDPPAISQISSIGMRPSLDIKSAEMQQEDQTAHDYINGQVDKLKRQGLPASGLVIWGDAAPAIASTFIDSDLLVMSSQGKTGLRRWFLGSVAEDLLKRSSIPVLLIR